MVAWRVISLPWSGRDDSTRRNLLFKALFLILCIALTSMPTLEESPRACVYRPVWDEEGPGYAMGSAGDIGDILDAIVNRDAP